jgi:hypothetical protein
MARRSQNGFLSILALLMLYVVNRIVLTTEAAPTSDTAPTAVSAPVCSMSNVAPTSTTLEYNYHAAARYLSLTRQMPSCCDCNMATTWDLELEKTCSIYLNSTLRQWQQLDAFSTTAASHEMRFFTPSPWPSTWHSPVLSDHDTLNKVHRINRLRLAYAAVFN